MFVPYFFVPYIKFNVTVSGPKYPKFFVHIKGFLATSTPPSHAYVKEILENTLPTKHTKKGTLGFSIGSQT